MSKRRTGFLASVTSSVLTGIGSKASVAHPPFSVLWPGPHGERGISWSLRSPRPLRKSLMMLFGFPLNTNNFKGLMTSCSLCHRFAGSWRHPPSGGLMLNVDASVVESLDYFAAGWDKSVAVLEAFSRIIVGLIAPPAG